ncbi:hypothetical protein Hanom_Chr11g00979651 [Helianthus anomalus]
MSARTRLSESAPISELLVLSLSSQKSPSFSCQGCTVHKTQTRPVSVLEAFPW